VNVRAAAYQRMVAITQDPDLHPDSKIGNKFGFLEDLGKQLEELTKDAANYQGGQAEAYKKTHAWFLSRTREQVIDTALNEYLAEARRIGGGLPFPLGTNRTERPPSADELITLNQSILEVSGDLASAAFKGTGAESRPEWMDFQRKLELARSITSALIVGGTALAQVNVLVQEYKMAPDEEWRLTYQFVERITGPPRPGPRIDQPLAPGQRIELGQLRVDAPITVRVFDRADSDSPGNGRAKSVATGPWGVLELIRQPGAEVDVANPSVWLVSWPLELEGTRGVLRLRLEFTGGRAPTPKDLGL
jgi:hypothetical protein